MIPKRLEMRNFLPYRDPAPLEFDGIHLACLSGQNGAGKSSILDALTWAIWGKARGNLMNDLVHQGQTEMSVTLDFEHEGRDYRVKRTRTTAGKGQTFLEFFVRTPDAKWELRNDVNLNATQKRIEELLHLDYDTFIATAYLQQGKADAFTTKTAAERKRVLFDILGLEVWEIYRERAKAKIDRLNAEEQFLLLRLRELEEELGREAEYQRQRDDAQKVFDDAEARLREAEAARELVKHAPRELEYANKKYEETSRRIVEYARKATQAQQHIDKLQASIAQYRATLAQAHSIEAGYAALQDVKAQRERLAEDLRVVRSLEEQQHALKQAISAARAALERDAAAVRARMTQLTQQVQAADDAAYAALNAQIAALEAQDVRLNVLQEQIAAQKEQRGGLKTRQDALREEGEKLKAHIAELQTTDDAECPLCGQPLTPEHLQTILLERNAELEQKRREWQAAQEAYNTLASALQQAEKEVKTLQKAVKPLAELRTQRGKLEQLQQQAQEARLALADAERELAGLEARLDAEDYAHAQRAELARLAAELAQLAYDDSQHAALQAQQASYEKFDAEYRSLELAKCMLPRDEATYQEEMARFEEWQRAIEELRAELEALKGTIRELTEMAQEYAKRDAEYNAQRTRYENARDGLSEAKQKLNSLVDVRQRKQESLAERANLRVQIAMYQELQMAFSKNGVPAMVMETAIPELEALANDLLARMTSGRMHLRLTTQRLTHSTDTLRETLDIEISDELGTRSYDLYSGGEAFRINFALRVALAKLLARRAGAHLQTLIIDEGFGTQDEEGRARLVEAITQVQEDFKMVLVITHLEDLRDAFPVHIVVEKTPHGSRLSLR